MVDNFAKQFTLLTQIQDVVNNLKESKITLDNVFEWTFNEKLRIDYEKSMNDNTIIKVQNYKLKQIQNKLTNINTCINDLPNNVTNMDIYASANSEQKMIEAKINNLMTVDEMRRLSKEYLDYRDKADAFFKQIRLF